MALLREVSRSSGSPGGTDVLSPAGPHADSAATLLWVLFSVATVVVVVVTVLVMAAAIRSSRNRDDKKPAAAATEPHPREGAGLRLVVVGGIVAPVIAGVAFFLMTIGPLAALSDHGHDPLIIDVTGHRWWWDVQYPGLGIRTANEIYLPVGRDAVLRLRSADVIHSVWVPELAGKVDAIPGRTNELVLHADRTGTFGGRCAEFCGLEHARMRFTVIVEQPDAFSRWTHRNDRTPTTPTGSALRGRDVFLGSACVYCHAVEGTNATSHLGPDLTHLASRGTLGAGTMPNDRGHLAGWLLDPQSAKPGNLMPAMDIPGDQLQSLLDYLQSLR